MPTGYTAGVKDGTVTDFKAFVMQCARAFGALIDMRDDPSDVPIPKSFAPSSYGKNILDGGSALGWHGQGGVIWLGLVFGLALIQVLLIVVAGFCNKEQLVRATMNRLNGRPTVTGSMAMAESILIHNPCSDQNRESWHPSSCNLIPLLKSDRKPVPDLKSIAWHDEVNWLIGRNGRAFWIIDRRRNVEGDIYRNDVGRRVPPIHELNVDMKVIRIISGKPNTIHRVSHEHIGAFDHLIGLVHLPIDARLNDGSEQDTDREERNPSGRTEREEGFRHNKFGLLLSGALIWGFCFVAANCRALRAGIDRGVILLLGLGFAALFGGILVGALA